MKKHLIFLLFILSLISCNTVNSLLQPDWVTKTPKIVGSVVYVGQGVGKSEEDARDKAYLAVLSKLGENLGYEISTQYFRELVSSDRIQSLSTRISDKYSYQQTNDDWIYYAMATTSSSTLKDSRSPEYILLLDREERISSSLEESLEYYKESEDIQAINKVLDAITISLEGDVNNPDYTPEALRDKAIEYIDNLRISFEHSKKQKSGITVKLKRTKGMFYPPVKNATLSAGYQMIDTSGNIIDSFFDCKTDKNGRYLYTNTNPYMIRKGEIVFSLSLDSERLKKIVKVAGEEFVQPIKEAYSSKSITYSYQESAKLPNDSTLIAYVLYDEEGNEQSCPSFAYAIDEYLKTVKATGYQIERTNGDEFEDIYEELCKNYPSYRYFIIIRAGVVGSKQNGEETASRAEGRVAFYDRTKEEQFAIQDSFMLGYGKDEESANVSALENVARIIAGRLLEEL